MNFDINNFPILAFLVAPLVGAIIGLITNGIAIRMLFRPLKPVKIGKFTLPLTPGIIPKEKPRIARACGNAIGEYLLNEEAMSETLLSDSMEEKIRKSCDAAFEKNKGNSQSVRDVIIHAMGNERADYSINRTKNKLSTSIYQKINSSDLCDKLAEMAVFEAQKNSVFGALSFLMNPDSLKKKLSDVIKHFIDEKGEELIYKAVDKEGEEFLNVTLDELYEKESHHWPAVREAVIEIYHRLVTKGLSQAMQAINIAGIVEDQINAFDVAEMERILVEIMDKELKAIVWFGGLLGFLMGIVMNFI